MESHLLNITSGSRSRNLTSCERDTLEVLWYSTNSLRELNLTTQRKNFPAASLRTLKCWTPSGHLHALLFFKLSGSVSYDKFPNQIRVKWNFLANLGDYLLNRKWKISRTGFRHSNQKWTVGFIRKKFLSFSSRYSTTVPAKEFL